MGRRYVILPNHVVDYNNRFCILEELENLLL